MAHYEPYYDLEYLIDALNAQRARQAAAASASYGPSSSSPYASHHGHTHGPSPSSIQSASGAPWQEPPRRRIHPAEAAAMQRAAASQKPRMDLYEDADANLVTAHFEFPGVAKEDIQIDVQNGRLTVAAEIRPPAPRPAVDGQQPKIRTMSPDEDENYVVQERRFGKLSRTIQLPAGIDEDDVKAYMENGLLTITFPQRAKERQPAPQRIFIQWC